MNKSDLIEHIAKEADLSKASAARALDAFVSGITETLKQGSEVSLVGFGTFAVGDQSSKNS